MEELGKNDIYEIISDNMKRTDESISHGFEMRIAHLEDLSVIFSEEIVKHSEFDDVMDAICLDESIPGYYEENVSFVPKNSFGTPNEGQYQFYRKSITEFDKIVFSKMLSEKSEKSEFKDYTYWLSGEKNVSTVKDVSIATTIGKQTNEAFEFFATKFSNCSPKESDNFMDVCDAVSKGEADFGIIPVSNTIDGRLSAYCSFIESNQLFIAMTTMIDSPDGENTTEFALVSSKLYSHIEDNMVFRIRITLEDYSEIENIFKCVDYNKGTLLRTDVLPQSEAARDNSLDILIDVTNADIKAIICYLKLNYPQFATVGLYTINGGNRW